ncbi:hypothetical protein Xcc1_08080 [Xanthomonas campestris pv. campestris]|nr:hypothetical protein Xcc1_08080 [Xanthomonas campestris pv. campestris]
MLLSLFVVDAFTCVRFKGNPAAVVPLQAWLPVPVMQAIAAENNLSETTFFVRDHAGVFDIRWFSPLKEVGFCGHATLASAYVIARQQLAPFPLRLRAPAVGEIGVEQVDEATFEICFPNQLPTLVTQVPAPLLAALSIAPQAVYANAQAYIGVYADEQQVRAVVPDLAQMLALAPRDVALPHREPRMTWCRAISGRPMAERRTLSPVRSMQRWRRCGRARLERPICARCRPRRVAVSWRVVSHRRMSTYVAAPCTICVGRSRYERCGCTTGGGVAPRNLAAAVGRGVDRLGWRLRA